MKGLQKELDKLRKQGYYFICTNSAYDPLGNQNYTPDGEYAVTIGKAGVLFNRPTAVHKELKMAIATAIRITNDQIARESSL